MSKRPIRWAILLVGVAVLMAILARPNRVRLERGLGRYLVETTLRDPANRPVALTDYLGRRATVLVFTGIDCPIGDLYMPRLAELCRRLGPRGVKFVAINSNLHQTGAQAAEHARTFGMEFPVLKDPENRLADRAGVSRTNEVLVLDARATAVPRGDRRPVHPEGPARTALAFVPDRGPRSGPRSARGLCRVPPGRRLPDRPRRSRRCPRPEQKTPTRCARVDRRPKHIGGPGAGRSRRCHLRSRDRPNLPVALPNLPSSGPGRPVLTFDVRASERARCDDR